MPKDIPPTVTENLTGPAARAAVTGRAGVRADELPVLVFQGGGALGAYQAGAYARLSTAGVEPEWLAGISIGAINAAIIAGNRKGERIEALRSFWERVTSGTPGFGFANPFLPRQMEDELSSYAAMAQGAPGFFRPRSVPPFMATPGTPEALSWYDTAPLERSLQDFVDFDLLNREGPRLSLGVVEVETGNFSYFDSRQTEITARHVMASGALPPGFAPVEIDGRHYWDGGLVSNTPLFHVLNHATTVPLCIFQLDLYPAQGGLPQTIFQAARREKDIRYSSRTRLITDHYRELGRIAAAADRLKARLGPDWAADPDLGYLCARGTPGPVTLVHLIQSGEMREGHSRDYEFSRQGMTDRWAAGAADVGALFDMPEWQDRSPAEPGLTIFDPAAVGEARLRRPG